ncbi:hypothetical protein DSECCO2_599090 [anaerobic digester metagenome]
MPGDAAHQVEFPVRNGQAVRLPDKFLGVIRNLPLQGRVLADIQSRKRHAA